MIIAIITTVDSSKEDIFFIDVKYTSTKVFHLRCDVCFNP